MNLSSPDEIATALKDGKYPDSQPWTLAAGAELIAAELISKDDKTTAAELRKVVGVLNAKRHFELTRKIARAWLDVRGFDVTVQRRMVQALINTTMLDEAEKLAIEGISKAEQMTGDAQSAAELTEYQGLRGRIFKQRYVLSGDLNWLTRSTDQYLAEYDKNPARNYWHGINAVALLGLELGESGARPGLPAMDDLAAKVRRTVVQAYATQNYKVWLAATASEACLALGQCDEAELWLYRFLHLPETEPFDIDSFARQLREIWHGDPFARDTCAGRLSSIISGHLARTQARLVLDPSQLPAVKNAVEHNREGLEKNFSGESSFSVESISRLLKACESIGCISNNVGERLGTGYLVRGSAIKHAYGETAVFITNAHVISKTVANAIPPENARVTFELGATAGGPRPEYRVKEVLSSSPPGKIGVMNATGDDLDYTIVMLEGLPPGATVLNVASNLPLVRPLTKAFVAGHPRGAGLQISLQDSTLLDIDDDERLMHYRTPTDPGSSGSPVFNSKWDVMGLHHAGTSETPRLHGSGTYEANEAITLAAIRKRLNA